MKSHYLQRMKRVRAVLAGRGLDALLITCPENRRYLSGFTAEDVGISESAGALLILCKESILLTDGRYEVQARDEAPDWRLFIYRRGLAHALKNLIHDRSVYNLAYEPDYLSCRRFEAIKKVLPETEFVSLGGRIETMRSIKSSSEPRHLMSSTRYSWPDHFWSCTNSVFFWYGWCVQREERI